MTKNLGSGTSAGLGGTQNDNTATAGYVVIYPSSAAVVGAGSSATYILKGDTSAMNKNALSGDTLAISIADGDFYWDDGTTVSGNQKVLNLPVTGGTLSY